MSDDRCETFEGEEEILESPFPTMVDPGFYREAEELYVYRHDGGFWVGFLPHEDVAVQLKVGVDELFLGEQRIDAPELLDTLRRVEPDAAEMEGHVAMEDPAKTADISIPFEEWVKLNCVEIASITVDMGRGSAIKRMVLERYYEQKPLREEVALNPFA